MPTIEQIKELRVITGAGLADVKEALSISKGDMEAAKAYLAKKGLAKAEKRADREANQGMIGSYIHVTNKVAALVELNCETDFVAKSDDFMMLAKEIAMQIAAMNPLYVSVEDVPASVREEFANEVKNDPKFANKPEEIRNNILDSKMKTYAEEVCLMDQAYFKDGSQNIGQMLKAVSAKVGEAIKIRRFVRYEVGV